MMGNVPRYAQYVSQEVQVCVGQSTRAAPRFWLTESEVVMKFICNDC